MTKKPGADGGRCKTDAADEPVEGFQTDPMESDIERFIARSGRRPRVLVNHIGLRRHRRALNQVATIFGEWGFDVDIGPACESPHQLARMAIDNDVHLVCLLCNPDERARAGTDLIHALQDCDGGGILMIIFDDQDSTGTLYPISTGQFEPIRMRSAAAVTEVLSILTPFTHEN